MEPEKFSPMGLNFNRQLNEEERYELDLYMRGQALAGITPTEGWEIAVNTLKSIADDAVDQLINKIAPGDTDRILAAHAVAWAQTKMYEVFTQAVADAVNAPVPAFAEEMTPEI